MTTPKVTEISRNGNPVGERNAGESVPAARSAEADPALHVRSVDR